MMKMRTILLVALVAGSGGYFWTTSTDPLVQAGCGLFWFLGVGLVLTFARSRERPNSQLLRTEHTTVDPSLDAHGLYRFPGDVLDTQNHPYPGANDRP